LDFVSDISEMKMNARVGVFFGLSPYPIQPHLWGPLSSEQFKGTLLHHKKMDGFSADRKHPMPPILSSYAFRNGPVTHSHSCGQVPVGPIVQH
jgi:hypothetical protein